MYKVKLSLNVQEDLERIEKLYYLISEKIADKFILNLSKTFKILLLNPHFSIKYKNYRTITLSKFPYIIFFEIDELNFNVTIFTCFHTSQNPNKYPI